MMTQSSGEEVLEAALAASLTRVIDLLKFAEAKNVALLAFASAWVVGLVNLLSSGKTFPPAFYPVCVLALILFVVSGAFAIVSLLPKLRTSSFTGGQEDEYLNLLYFGDIASETVESFLIEIRKRYLPGEGESVAEHHIVDLAAQVAINSRIAKRKYLLFNSGALAALFAICSFSVPAVGLLINFIL